MIVPIALPDKKAKADDSYFEVCLGPCGAEISSDEIYCLRCGHRICFSCLRTLLGSAKGLPCCPVEECEAEVNRDDLLTLLEVAGPELREICTSLLPFIAADEQESNRREEEGGDRYEIAKEKEISLNLNVVGSGVEVERQIQCKWNSDVSSLYGRIKNDPQLRGWLSGEVVCYVVKATMGSLASDARQSTASLRYKVEARKHGYRQPFLEKSACRALILEEGQTLKEFGISDGDYIEIDASPSLNGQIPRIDRSEKQVALLSKRTMVFCPGCELETNETIPFGRCGHRICVSCLASYVHAIQHVLSHSEQVQAAKKAEVNRIYCPLQNCNNSVEGGRFEELIEVIRSNRWEEKVNEGQWEGVMKNVGEKGRLRKAEAETEHGKSMGGWILLTVRLSGKDDSLSLSVPGNETLEDFALQVLRGFKVTKEFSWKVTRFQRQDDTGKSSGKGQTTDVKEWDSRNRLFNWMESPGEDQVEGKTEDTIQVEGNEKRTLNEMNVCSGETLIAYVEPVNHPQHFRF